MTDELRKAVFENYVHEYSCEVTSFDVDCFGRLRLSALMSFEQETVERHIAALGASSLKLAAEHGIAFVFTKAALDIHRLPSVGEKLSVMTWCSGVNGIRFLRNYRTESENGEIIAESLCEVVLIDLESRKLVKSTSFDAFGGFRYYNGSANGCEYPRKVRLPETELQEIRRVRFSDTDRNGHLNNTVYADIVMDCIPKELQNKTPARFTINYSNEAVAGDEIALRCAAGTNKAVVGGTVGERICFTAEMVY